MKNAIIAKILIYTYLTTTCAPLCAGSSRTEEVLDESGVTLVRKQEKGSCLDGTCDSCNKSKVCKVNCGATGECRSCQGCK